MASRQTAAALIAASLLVLAGCAGLGPYASSSGQGPGAGPTEVTGEPGSRAPQAASSSDPAQLPGSAPQPAGAAAYLLGEAQRLSALRQFDQASAQLERALRIEPSNPWLYLALADVRLAQRDPQQAAVLVRRARSLSRGDPAVLADADALSLRNPRPETPP